MKNLKSTAISSCESLMYSIYTADERNEMIQYLASIARNVSGFSRQHSRDYISGTLTENTIKSV